MSPIALLTAAVVMTACGGDDSVVDTGAVAPATESDAQPEDWLPRSRLLALAIESGAATGIQPTPAPAIGPAVDLNTVGLVPASAPTPVARVLAASTAGPSLTSFGFLLPRASTTSAGVFDTDGKLIRTLWAGDALPAGAAVRTWDGNTDEGQPAPAGAYEIRVLHHQLAYRWEGVIGNSSTAREGNPVHKAFLPPTSLHATGDQVFYAVGYNEAQSGLHGFRHADPQINSRPADLVDPFSSVAMVTADAGSIYWANTGGLAKTSFVARVDVATGKPKPLPSGADVCLNRFADGKTCYPHQDHRGVLGLETDPSWAPTGLSVQQDGELLAVAHGGRNQIRVYDKTSGRLVQKWSVELRSGASNQIAFSPTGDLWVVSGRHLKLFSMTAIARAARAGTNPRAGPSLTVKVKGLSMPLAVAVSPTDPDRVWVADGGSSQQLKRFNRRGLRTSVLGAAGGYGSSPEAAARRYCFKGPLRQQRTALTLLPDHSMWLVDTCNNRMLHLREDGGQLNQVAYLPAVYAATVDLANPRRVFANYLEFEVDTGSSLVPGKSWVLRRNWLAGLPAELSDEHSANWAFGGLRTVVTLSNGRTIGMMVANRKQYLVELPSTGPVRVLEELTSPMSGATVPVLYENGDVGWAVTADQSQSVYRRRLAGFDAKGQPAWAAAPERLAQVPIASTTPHFRGAFSGILGPRFPLTESGRVIYFDQSVSEGNIGFHLGAADRGGSQWSWQASPTAALDGKGSFQGRPVDPGIHYGGNAVWASGRHVVYGYHGEFYTDLQNKNIGQANQFMHFRDDGLFLGQFGVPSTRRNGDADAGLSGNAFSPTLIRADDKLYLLHNDESAHGGVHRWRIDGWNDVQDIKAIVVKGSNSVLN